MNLKTKSFIYSVIFGLFIQLIGVVHFVEADEISFNRYQELKVIGVVDGDTLDVLVDKKPIRLRLYGIDAPEKKQPFGEKAKQRVSNLVFGKFIEVQPIKKERYGRYIAKIKTSEGKDLSEELVSSGLAWWYQKYAPKDIRLKDLEARAKRDRVGLWSDPRAVSPWEFRE